MITGLSDSDIGYLFIGQDNKIISIDKTTMVESARQNLTSGSVINKVRTSITSGTDFVLYSNTNSGNNYVGFSFTDGLSFWGGMEFIPPSDGVINDLLWDDIFPTTGGYYLASDNYIRRYFPGFLNIIYDYGGKVNALTQDTNYIYAGGVGGILVKLNKVDMTLVDSYDSGFEIRGIASDIDNIYVSGTDNVGEGYIQQILKSSMEQVGPTIYILIIFFDPLGFKAISTTDSDLYYYVGTMNRLLKIEKGSSTKVGENYACGWTQITQLVFDGTYSYIVSVSEPYVVTKIDSYDYDASYVSKYNGIPNTLPTIPVVDVHPNYSTPNATNITWSASTDPDLDPITYDVKVGTSSGATDVINQVGDGKTGDTSELYSNNFNPISPTSYYYSVRACDGIGCSDYSSEQIFYYQSNNQHLDVHASWRGILIDN